MNHPIVVLHGWGLSAKTFEPLVAELKKQHFQVMVPDFPGFDSLHIPAKPLTLADYADFLDSYLRKHHIEKPILIGHSFGGRVALKYQYDYPGNIAALILTGAPGFTPVSRKKLALFISIAKIGGTLFSLPLLYRLKDRVRLWYYYVVGARDFYRAEGVMRETFKNIVKEPLVSCMENVRVPTLLVWGESDVIVPVSVAARMEKVIRGAKLLVLPHEGHNVPYKKPKEFTAAIYDFLLSIT
jgi:pimeloyl-ACP methyl ester carboxylesterase